MKDKSDQVAKLIDKAANAEKPDDALKFSQAACNSANAMHTVRVATRPPAKPMME